MIPEVVRRTRFVSYEDYLAQAPEDQIVEWVDGEIIVHMPPLYTHQFLAGFLESLLRLFSKAFDLGEVISAPFEVKLWPGGPSREPDVLFIRNENLDQLVGPRFNGGPDLIIEVVSPGSVTIDRVDKFREYEQAGVAEYWLIDPRPRQQQADFYLLDSEGLFRPAALQDGRFYSHILPGFWLDIEWLFQKQLPDPQLAFAQIMVTMETLSPEVRQLYEQLLKLRG